MAEAQIAKGLGMSIRHFTDDQNKAYNELMEFIKAPFDIKRYKYCLLGAAGTGKTYLLKALLVNSGISSSLIGLAAPTHKACRVLGDNVGSIGKINTLASDLGIQIDLTSEQFNPNNPRFAPKNKGHIDEFKLYIIDESSMIDRNLLLHLEKKIRENCIKLIYVGDPSQLPPVGERISPAFQYVPTVQLNKVVRQGENNPISDLLKQIRVDVDKKTYKSISYLLNNRSNMVDGKGYEVLSTNDFCSKIIEVFGDGNIQNDVDYCKVIAYTNDQVSYWTKNIRNRLIANADKAIINNNDLVTAYKTVVNIHNGVIIRNSEDYIIKDVVNYVDERFGYKGYFVKFTSIHGGVNAPPMFIIDHTDPLTLKKYYNRLYEFASHREWKQYYEHKDKYLCFLGFKTDLNSTFKKDIDYGFAITSYKAQGSTYNTVFVDLTNIMYDKNGNLYANAATVMRHVYVACSRAKTKLYIRFDG